jgi:beta-glucosidase
MNHAALHSTWPARFIARVARALLMPHAHRHRRAAAVCMLGMWALVCRGAGALPVIHPAAWPALPPAIPADAKVEAFVERLLHTMTLEEKVGQLVQADIDSITPEDLRTYHLGSILAGGNAAPGRNVRSSAASWLDLADAYYRAALADPSPAHPAIPIIFGIDAVHGHARIPGATVFPHNAALGAAHDPALIERIGRATAEEVAATGLDWTFAPTVAVVRDPRWGRTYESYSEDPQLVARYAHAMVTGLQGHLGTKDFMSPGHTLVSVKHFLGDGSTINGRDQFDSGVDEATLRDVHGAGYPAALSAGALIVMASYNGWQGTKMHANHALLTQVLKQRWSFPGFVVGDWNGHEEIPGCTKYSCPAALAAGLDMYMAPDSWKTLYANLLQQARSGQVTSGRIDDAARRILRVKALAGLFGKPAPKDRAAGGGLTAIGSAAHRAIAREAVRKSLVLLKNNGGLLPLDPHAHVLVTGAGADDIGMQCGGWTIDWQGDHNTNADFPGATSIYAGIRAAVEQAGGTTTQSVDGSYQQRPDAAIVVFGETAYAEFEGDRETLDYSALDARPLQLLRRLHAEGIPVVSIFLSGRPLWVNPELNASDAFVAAWLPGSEGGGIADLLFRPRAGTQAATAQDFSGRLAFSWPATAMPASYLPGGAIRGALFKRGYGLSLATRSTLARLPEDPQVPPAHATLFAAGHVTAPQSIYVADRAAQVRLTMQSQSSPDGNVTAALGKQHLQATWSGAGWGELRIGGRASDYSAAAAQGLALQLRLRVDVPPTHAVRLGVRCEAPYGPPAPAAAAPPPDWSLCGRTSGAMLDVTNWVNADKRGVWRTLAVPLACLAGSEAILARVNSPFAIETDGALALSFDDIRLTASPSPPDCASATQWAGSAKRDHDPGGERQQDQ